MKIYQDKKLLGEVITNHSITTEEALKLLGAKPMEMKNIDDPQFIMPDGTEVWWDCIEEEA